MNARSLLKKAADSGVELHLTDGTLKVRGCREAVEIFLPELRTHKTEIVELLASVRMVTVNDPRGPELETLSNTQPRIPNGAGFNKSVKSRKLTFMEWQQGWIEFDQAYQRHHFNCAFCIAAGLGYGLRCGAGAALWTVYSSAT